MSWAAIASEYTRGIITGYTVEYRETRGVLVVWRSVHTKSMHAEVSGLEEFFNYTVKVAGNTSKGVGVFSSMVYIQTDQDGKIDE